MKQNKLVEKILADPHNAASSLILLHEALSNNENKSLARSVINILYASEDLELEYDDHENS